MAGVTLSHIRKVFRGQRVVEDINLEIEDGQFVVLVGPSGCGKTTILRMIAGLETTDHGDIFIGGRKVNHLSPKERDIAMVFQSYALYPHMTVYQNMAFGLSLRGMAKSEIERYVRQAAELLGIAEKLNTKPGRLSGGQRQRVALGRALVRRPQVFLFDEPLSNLDANLRVQMRAELIQLHRRLKTTTLYVTHDQVEAMTLGEKIAVLNDGALQQYSSPRETYRAPTNMFVAGFIGSPTMNFIPARALPESGSYRLEAAGLTLKVTKAPRQPLPPEVVVGIRPEDLRGPLDAAAENGLVMESVLSENLGHTQLVYGTCGANSIVAGLEADLRITAGTHLFFGIKPDAVHFFDPISKAALH